MSSPDYLLAVVLICYLLLRGGLKETQKETENIKQGFFFLYTRVLFRVSPTPAISFRHTLLVSVCAGGAKSMCLLPTGECVLCVCSGVWLLVFFSGSKVELHGFVDFPVLFADELQGERTVENLSTETSMSPHHCKFYSPSHSNLDV